jgi:RHS repeat-associated protein
MRHQEKVIRSFTKVLLAFLLCFGWASGQEKRDPDRGFVAGGSYALSDIETINTTNGNLMLNIPLASLPAGRGPGYTLALRYNSKLWNSQGTRQTDVVNPETNEPEYFNLETLTASDAGGWSYSGFYQLEVMNRRDLEPIDTCSVYSADYEKSAYLWKLKMRFPDGSVHEFRPSGQNSYYDDGYFKVDPNGRTYSASSTNCTTSTQTTTSGMTYYSTDGSFMRLVVDYVAGNDGPLSAGNPWTLYMPDGGKVVRPSGSSNPGYAQRIYDRNGNYISLGTANGIVEDQFGRSITIENDPADSSKQYVKRKGVAGEEVMITVKWKEIWVNRLYDSAPGTLYCGPGRHSQPLTTGLSVIDYIQLPDQSGGLKYTFGYNGSNSQQTGTNYTNGWGEVAGVELPSGASVAYTYAYDASPSTPAIAPQSNTPIQKQLTYLLEYDGSSSPTTETWSYNITDSGSTITGPDGAQTQQLYGSLNSPGTAFPGYVYREVKPDGTMIERIWAVNAPELYAYDDGDANPYVKTEFVSIKNAAGSYTLTSAKDYELDKNGNVLAVKEYDWMPYSSVPRIDGRPTGLPSGSSSYLKRMTANEYYNPVPNAAGIGYDDPNGYHLSSSPRLLNLLKATEVQEGNGTPRSRSEMTYDFTSYSSNTLGGNLTQTKSWDSYKNGAAQSHSNPLTSTNSVTTSVSYNSCGLPETTTDANLNVTHITYGNVQGPAGPVTCLYPTQTVSAYGKPVARTSSAVYDFYTGLVTTATDVDNNVSTVTIYDRLGRPTKVKTAAGTTLESWTQTEYDDVNRRVIVRSDIDAVGDGRRVATQFYDQLGRVRLTKTLEDASTQSATNETDGIKVETRYRTTTDYVYQLTSNPFRASSATQASAESTMGWTRSKAWSDGTRSEVETFAGASLPAPWGTNANTTGKVITEIDANATTVTDQAGKLRRSITNALGQLTRVDEPDGSNNLGSVTTPNQPTVYSYDVLNNLLTVTQAGNGDPQCGPSGGNCSQTRTFTYSSLSRLISAANPESGSIGYSYEPNGNLTVKKDARGVQTDFVYDELNRVKTRSYSTPTGTPQNYEASPNVTYTYDDPLIAHSKGKLTKVSTGTGANLSTTEYAELDILGRVTRSIQTTDGVVFGGGGDPNYWMTYSYNLSGALIEQQYPSGRRVKNELDASGDLALVESKKNSSQAYWNFANHFSYNSSGAVTSMQLGNGSWESTKFNERLQPTQIALGRTQGTTDLLKLDYGYGTTANNGNVISQTITVAPVGAIAGFTAVQSYSYDSLNRIQLATETLTPTTGTPESWTQDFRYDRYGNRTFNESTTTTLPKECNGNTEVCAAIRPVVNPSVNPNDNKLVGYSFDAAGNTKQDAENRKFTYDSENKQTKVETLSGSTVTGTVGEYFYDGDGKRIKKKAYQSGVLTEETIFVYDAAGKLIAEHSNQVASSQDPKIAYLTNDHLGSPRINTDVNGNVISRHDYHPFGEEVASSKRVAELGYVDDSVRKQFTGYERDNEINLDYAGARYYSNAHGRFTSTDPILIKKDRLVDPQRLNLYVYVRNSPYRFVDTTGEDLILANSNARTTFRQVTTNGLTRAERNNVRVRADGRVVLRNPNAVNVGNASYAYQQIAGIVGNRNLTINVYSVAQGQTAQGVSYQDAYSSAGVTLGSPGDATRDVVIPVGGGVQVAGAPSGSGNQVPTTEDTVFAHEVFGHANGNDGDASITAENNYRRSRNPALGERSGEDHRFEVPVSAPIEPITTTSAQQQTTVSPRPLIPLLMTPPPPPKKPEELED